MLGWFPSSGELSLSSHAVSAFLMSRTHARSWGCVEVSLGVSPPLSLVVLVKTMVFRSFVSCVVYAVVVISCVFLYLETPDRVLYRSGSVARIPARNA